MGVVIWQNTKQLHSIANKILKKVSDIPSVKLMGMKNTGDQRCTNKWITFFFIAKTFYQAENVSCESFHLSIKLDALLAVLKALV